jgi:hypothetical protein
VIRVHCLPQVGPAGIFYFFCPNSLCIRLIPRMHPIMLGLCPIILNYSGWPYPQAAKVYTFRRGTLSATIRSLAFGPPAAGGPPLLAASSEKGTVHVFRIEGKARPGTSVLFESCSEPGTHPSCSESSGLRMR